MSGTLPSVFTFENSIADAEAPSPLPAGEYRAVVKAIEARPSKSSGKPMADFTYVISADQYPPDYVDGDPDGTKLHFYLPLSGDARSLFRIRKICEMHGVVAQKELNLVDFMGTEVMAAVSHEDYQGAPQARLTPVREV